jgi:acyl-CoA synthetase (AMP-forming)/AMP-acid ligase II
VTAAANVGIMFAGHAGPAVLDLARGDDPPAVAYGALEGASNAVARGLRARGLGVGDRVGILALNRVEYLETIFGAMRAGVVPVPLNARLPAETIDLIARDAGTRLVFTDAPTRRLVPAGVPVVDYDDGGYAAFLDPGPYQAVAPADDAVCIQVYTSGSSGRPKGVLLGHAGQRWTIATSAAARGLGSAHRLLVAAPLYHKNALVAVKMALWAGASIVLLPRFDAARAIAAIGRHRCTHLTGVPTMFALVLAERAALATTDLSSVAVVGVGSAPASDALLDALGAAFPRARVVNGYGLTEGQGMFGPHPDGLPRPPLSIGFPHRETDVRLVGGPSPDEGVLHVRYPGLMLGYHGRPAETAERLRDGWLDTGDVCRRDARGWLYFVSRADDMFVCGGENVFPGDVEALLERHPGVEQAAVVPVAHALKGHVPYAFVVPRATAALGEDEVKRFALEHGPAYQHPRRVFVVDALPLASTNKIDRQALKARAAAAAEPVRT